MPNYDTHAIVNYVVFILVSIFTLHNSYLNIIHLLTLFIGVYIGTNYITPDVDTQSIPYKKLKVIWVPYNRITRQTKHRGKSHSIAGIFLRIIFITLLFLFIAYASGELETLIDFITSTNPIYIILFLSGIISANTIHIILDRYT